MVSVVDQYSAKERALNRAFANSLASVNSLCRPIFLARHPHFFPSPALGGRTKSYQPSRDYLGQASLQTAAVSNRSHNGLFGFVRS